MSKTIDQGKEEIAALCRYFTTNRREFNPGAKEAHIRQTLIDPFFEALGWDVRNKTMAAPQYREVIPEDSLDVEGQQKAPDYTFRVGTLPKFYVEAKKCGVNIGADSGPAFQLRRYGWSAKLGLSVLTNFEELAIYDCTARPRQSDKASNARIQFFRYDEYPDRWRELWDLFSREAVWSGAFDQYVASKRKRGTSEVDAEFLKEMESWRLALAGNIALRNKNLSLDDLNAAVQLTIDRVVFLRMAEDRGLEPYEQLLKLCERPGIYPRFIRGICRRADQKYNSGLFHFQKESGVSEDPDRITPKLATDDKIFKPILESLYFSHGSPYHFGVLPVEILGTVYERFLGKVIRLTAGHHARIEEKPEVRKAGGVYYTPAYIVDYIVKHTVAAQIEGRSPTQLAGEKDRAPFRVLDMACGSGSFLLSAYRCLLDYCLNWYIEHKPDNFRKAVYKDPRNGQWRLKIEEKKRILTTHIFGVDIDLQAVEVSKLSLLLKVLEGETDQSLSLSQLPFGDRALPNLADNIKCGNSLIGPDYFTDKLFLDPEEMKRVNPLDWKQRFPDTIKSGGFDCIIGNPPYLKIEHIVEGDRKYFSLGFASFMKRYDTYGLFVERSLVLLKPKGLFGMIIPSTILNNLSFSQLRKMLVELTSISSIVNLGGKVFQGVNNDTVILTFAKGKDPVGTTQILDVQKYGGGLATAAAIGTKDLSRAAAPPQYVFELRMSKAADSILAKMRSGGLALGEICSCFQGFVTGGNDAYIVDSKSIRDENLEKEVCKPAVFGDQVSRYGRPSPQGFVIYLTRDSNLDEFPNIKARLEPHKANLKTKREVKLGRQPWYSLHWPRVQENFERSPKILVQAIRNLALKRRIIATLDSRGLYADHTLNVLYTEHQEYDIIFVLGILNSALVNFLFSKKYIDINIKGVYLTEAPIPRINFSAPADRKRHDQMVTLVNSILGLHNEVAETKSAAQKAILQRQIDSTDAEIDRLVYDLYGLTAEEIATVEGATASVNRVSVQE